MTTVSRAMDLWHSATHTHLHFTKKPGLYQGSEVCTALREVRLVSTCHRPVTQDDSSSEFPQSLSLVDGKGSSCMQTGILGVLADAFIQTFQGNNVSWTLVFSSNGSHLTYRKQNHYASHTLCKWVISSRGSTYSLLQNQMKPYIHKQHRSCRVTDSELWACCFCLQLIPSIFQASLISKRDREKQTQWPWGLLQMWARPLKVKSCFKNHPVTQL